MCQVSDCLFIGSTTRHTRHKIQQTLLSVHTRHTIRTNASIDSHKTQDTNKRLQMPLAHRSVLAHKLRTPQSLDGITYNPVASSFPAPVSSILPGSKHRVDTGLNTLKLSQQLKLQSQPRRRRRIRQRPGTESTMRTGPHTFGVVGHQEDSHLDRLEKLGRKRPGPAEYSLPDLHSIGGKFNLANGKSDVDWLCYHASRQPGPGTYNLPPRKVHGGKFSNAFPKSDVDWLIYYASMKPGVGEYDLDESFHNYVGPGPEARMSAVDRGLYKEQSTYIPKKLPRKIARKMIAVTDKVHQNRLNRRSYARYNCSDSRRQSLDRHHTSKTLTKSLHGLRKSLSTGTATSNGLHFDASLSLGGGTELRDGIDMGSSLGLACPSMFRHASASELCAPPVWDKVASTNHHESSKKRGEHFVVPKQKQGGAGACWASSSAGLIFVAQNEHQYKLDKLDTREVRSVVRVAPLRVPRF